MTVDKKVIISVLELHFKGKVLKRLSILADFGDLVHFLVKLLLVKIIENYKIDAYFRSDYVN